MRRRRPHLRRQKHALELLWPFLVIILVGIIVVLMVQFVATWFDQRQAELKNKIYLYLDQGTAMVLPWGAVDWGKAYDGQLVLEGDEIRIGRASRGVLRFFNDSVVRLDADARLEVDEILTGKDEDVIHLNLKNGQIWVSMVESSDSLRFVVETQNVRLSSFGDRFAVGMTDRETVRVLEGEVLAQVVDDSNGREIILEEVKVGVGQEIDITASDLSTMMAHQPVALLDAVDDAWKATDWYSWNKNQDQFPTDFSGRVGAVMEEPEVVEEVVEEEVIEEVEEIVEEVEEEEEDFDSVAPVVVLRSPEESPYVLPEGELSISFAGTTSENTEKVIVTSYLDDGTASPYVLQQYEAGTTTWRYGASGDFGNLREGRNRFTIVAMNGSDVESAGVEVIVEVPEGAFAVEEEEVDEAATEKDPIVEDEVVDETGASDDPVLEDVVADDDESSDLPDVPLTVPVVLSLNNDALPAGGRYSTGAAVVTVLGSVSESTATVYVNNYELSKYVPGSGEWSYVVRPEFLNYNVGLNTYEVVAEDESGLLEKAFSFEIYRVAP